MKDELKQLVKEYFEQNNYGTAYPIYFTIRDVEYIPCYHFEDGERYVLVQDGSISHVAGSIKKLFEQLIADKDEYEFEGLEDADLEDNLFTEYDCKKFVEDNSDYVSGIFVQEAKWLSKGVFLFESEAEQHLKNNKHHYSDEAYVYCSHAWRASKTEKLLNLLEDECYDE